MRKPTPVSADERQRIVEALRAGESQTSVAKRFGRSPSTINKIAQEEGLEYTPPTKANQARSQFAKEGRIRLLDKALRKVDEMLGQIRKPYELNQLSIALAVLLDKRRQEDDEGPTRKGAIAELMDRLREGEDGDEASSPDG